MLRIMAVSSCPELHFEKAGAAEAAAPAGNYFSLKIK